MAERAGPAGAHAEHDLVAVAASVGADGSVAAEVGARLVVACSDCAALAADLGSIAGATTTLRSIPISAPRDFRLSEADARRLSRRGWLRRLVASPDGRGTRRLQGIGGAVAALGLAGFAFAAVGPDGSIEAATDLFTGTRDAPAAGDTSYEPAPALGPVASSELAPQDDATTKAVAEADTTDARQVLGAASGAAIVAGVGLVLLARARRRAA